MFYNHLKQTILTFLIIVMIILTSICLVILLSQDCPLFHYYCVLYDFVLFSNRTQLLCLFKIWKTLLTDSEETPSSKMKLVRSFANNKINTFIEN